ncbi:hypothetical protein RhiirA1_497644, partial [Rhizophagus irregularis]
MHVVIQLFKMLHKYYTQARREIRYLQNTSKNEDIGYVTFVLFPRHFAEGVVREKTISQIQLFRNYLLSH